MLPRIPAQKKTKNRSAHAVACLAAALFFFSFFSPESVFAQVSTSTDTFGVGQVETGITLGSGDIRLIVANIIRAVLGLLGVIALILVLYAGFTIMTAGGNEEKITEGKRILTNAVIGLAIILSAFSIVQFIISSLSANLAGGGGAGVGTAGAPAFQSFSGSGSLGRVIKDHYPARDQKNVSRNTSIAITFSEPISPSSIIDNANRTCWPKSGTTPVSMDRPDECLRNQQGAIVEYFGDCLPSPAGTPANPRAQCDHLKGGVSPPVSIGRRDGAGGFAAASALASYNQTGEATTFVFRPFEFLGEAGQTVWYSVTTTNAIQKANGEPLFKNQFSSFYQWEFETNGSIDVTAPTITSVFPEEGTAAARNTILQITLSEAMDPMLVQGLSGPETAFSHIIFHDSRVRGEWRVSNGYKTVEFISNEPCGQNSCGDAMFCLPVLCPAGSGVDCSERYRVLSRTADLASRPEQPFAGQPFSGVMDMAGNALDGNKNGRPDGKPNVGNQKIIGANEFDAAKDNAVWNFTVKNEIDRSAPAVEQVLPGIDQEGVRPDEPVTIRFNRSMMSNTLSKIQMDEYRQNDAIPVEPSWFSISGATVGGKTVATAAHRPFGPNGRDYYYMVSVPSTVKGSNQNCLYPGRGPYGEKNTSPVCSYSVNVFGDPVNVPSSCAPVTVEPHTDTGCVQTSRPDVSVLQKDVPTCVQLLKNISVNAAE